MSCTRNQHPMTCQQRVRHLLPHTVAWITSYTHIDTSTSDNQSTLQPAFIVDTLRSRSLVPYMFGTTPPSCSSRIAAGRISFALNDPERTQARSLAITACCCCSTPAPAALPAAAAAAAEHATTAAASSCCTSACRVCSPGTCGDVDSQETITSHTWLTADSSSPVATVPARQPVITSLISCTRAYCFKGDDSGIHAIRQRTTCSYADPRPARRQTSARTPDASLYSTCTFAPDAA
mmetsp:Transcript_11567/g.24804  ORF Transcript_11567/g.24804 Transcript_11567/m.24804 type:complete len:236 (+) Transcript_11567:380-1087(+)